MALRWQIAVPLALLAVACILPDQDIIVRTEDQNDSPVRIVQPTPLSLAAQCACDPAGCTAADPADWNPTCPQPDASGLPHFLDPGTNPQFQFCSCPLGEVDPDQLPAFELFAEDQDVENDAPKDDLFAVLLLDLQADDDPTSRVAYTRYLNANNPLPAAFGDYAPELRPSPQLRSVFIGDVDARIDLCNGNLSPLSVGWHTVRVLVTDRPWFTTSVTGGGQGDGGETTVQQIGVPDVAAGATFDSRDYTFFCSNQEEDGDPFDCANRCQEASG